VFDFNGSSQYIRVVNASHLQPTSAISLSAWIKGDTWSSGDSVDAILRKGDANPNNYQLAVADGRIAMYLDDSDTAGAPRALAATRSCPQASGIMSSACGMARR
jgi:hypothetical protein